MRKDECHRFEGCLAAEAELDEELLRHGSECPTCRALAQVSALSAPPVLADAHDAFVEAVRATASSMAQARAARWERRRRLVPLLIGLAGYLTAGLTAVLVLTLDGHAGRAIPRAADLSVPTVPPPQPAALVAAFAAAAVWIAAVAFVTRARCPVLEPSARAGQP